jgi:hypothetical protein
MKSWKAFVIVAGICLGATLLAGCDQMPPIDDNFDSSLGADFKPPADSTPDGGTTDAGDAAAPTAP